MGTVHYFKIAGMDRDPTVATPRVLAIPDNLTSPEAPRTVISDGARAGSLVLLLQRRSREPVRDLASSPIVELQRPAKARSGYNHTTRISASYAHESDHDVRRHR